ncbi:MAG: hypothetical protein AAGF24_03050 [Cyanobacteria bacterium P01_H01_bin.121]
MSDRSPNRNEFTLNPQHFADLIRTAQLIYDPSGGLSGRKIEVRWEAFGIPTEVEADLRIFGEQHRFASPYLPPEQVWAELTPLTRAWFLENRRTLWRFEEIFAAYDED